MIETKTYTEHSGFQVGDAVRVEGQKSDRVIVRIQESFLSGQSLGVAVMHRRALKSGTLSGPEIATHPSNLAHR